MYRLILVPVDGSGAGTTGLDEAIKMALHAGARLHLMNIADNTAFRSRGHRRRFGRSVDGAAQRGPRAG